MTIRIPASGATHRTESVGPQSVVSHHVLYDVVTEFPSALGRLQDSESQRVRPEAEAASAAVLMSSFSVLMCRSLPASVNAVAVETGQVQRSERWITAVRAPGSFVRTVIADSDRSTPASPGPEICSTFASFRIPSALVSMQTAHSLSALPAL